MRLQQSREEFRSLLLKLLSIPTEDREAKILTKLDRISPDPAYLDYVYNSMEFYDEDGHLDVDAVVEKVFSYQPIQL